MARLKTKYHDEIMDIMIQRFKYSNRMAVPRLEKIIVNMGLGEAIANPKVMESAVNELRVITG